MRAKAKKYACVETTQSFAINEMLDARVGDTGSVEVKVEWEPTWVRLEDFDSLEGKTAAARFVSAALGPNIWQETA